MVNTRQSVPARTEPATLFDMPEAYVTTAEAARALGVGRGTLARWVREGRIRPTAKTPGGQYRWDLDELRHQLRELAEADQPPSAAD